MFTFENMSLLKYPHSLLFKISGKDLKKPSWILGTMHMICAEDFKLPEKVIKALKKCNYYFMEVDLGSSGELDMMHSNSVPVSDFTVGLTAEQEEELSTILKRELGMTLDDAKQLPPVAILNKMTTDAIGCTEYKIAEFELMQLAHQEGISTGGLETAAEQLRIAEKVFDGKEILKQLRSSGDYKELFVRMMAAYKNENLMELSAFIADKRFMSRRAFNILVLQRNSRWAKKIPELIKKNSVFIAVGAGHLPGERGVINLLQMQGYSVNPVYR